METFSTNIKYFLEKHWVGINTLRWVGEYLWRDAIISPLCVSQVPLKVAVSVGKSWGSMSELHTPPSVSWIFLCTSDTKINDLISSFLMARVFSIDPSAGYTLMFWPLLGLLSCSSLSASSFCLLLHSSSIQVAMETRQLQLVVLASTLSVSGGNRWLDWTSSVLSLSLSCPPPPVLPLIFTHAHKHLVRTKNVSSASLPRWSFMF